VKFFTLIEMMRTVDLIKRIIEERAIFDEWQYKESNKKVIGQEPKNKHENDWNKERGALAEWCKRYHLDSIPSNAFLFMINHASKIQFRKCISHNIPNSILSYRRLSFLNNPSIRNCIRAVVDDSGRALQSRDEIDIQIREESKVVKRVDLLDRITSQIVKQTES
jgi:hypothetical protein